MPLILWVAGRQVIQGKLEIGALTSVVFYIMTVGHRMGMVGQFTTSCKTRAPARSGFSKIIREPRTLRSGKRPLPKGAGAGGV